MSRRQKLIAKLRSVPKDFTWRELVTLLSILGYSELGSGRTGGSRRRFVHPFAGPIILHQPHPANVLKLYQVRQILEHLNKEGLI